MARSKKRKKDEKVELEENEAISPHGQEVDEGGSKKDQKEVAPFYAKSEGEKYRLTFLSPQKFRGVYYGEGETIETSQGIFKAYKGRKALKFEKI